MSSDSDDEHQECHSRPLPEGEPSSNEYHFAAITHDGAAVEDGEGTISPTGSAQLEKKTEEPVTWASLPHRSQLIILTLARLSEPLVQTSLQVCSSFNDREWRFITLY